MKKSHFTIAVKGRGKFLGGFISEAFSAFPNATIYDRTDQIESAIMQEVKLGLSGYLTPEGRASAWKAAKNLFNPKPTDVTVTFKDEGYNSEILIEGRRRTQTLCINTADLTMEKYDAMLAQIVAAVEAVL